MVHPQARAHIDLAQEIIKLEKAERLRVILKPFQNGPVLRPKQPDIEARVYDAIRRFSTFDDIEFISKMRPAFPSVKLDKPLMEKYYRLFEGRIDLRAQTLLRSSIWEEVRPKNGRIHHGVFGPFCMSLFVPSALALIGETDEAKKFDPLLALWSDGNFPIGFHRNRAVILVAP